MAEDPESEAELTEILASEILDKIQKREPVEYDHVRVTDDLDVNKLDLPIKHVDRSEDLEKIWGISEECKVVSVSIKITNSTFNSKVNFINIFFEGLINFKNTTFKEDVQFSGATFKEDVQFSGARATITFIGDADFCGATFIGDADFEATFIGDAYFIGTIFSKCASFDGATFRAFAAFTEATFREDTSFEVATFREDAYFSRATFRESVYFIGTTFSWDAYFSRATFRGGVAFSGAKFAGDVLTFRNAVFNIPKSQEEACRRAKNVLVKAGNRDEEEYHFYREMEAKRIQKGIRGNSGLGLGYLLLKTETWSFWRFFWYDVLEFFFVQKIFGYGVHPFWLFGWWLGFVVVFAAIYLIKDGIEQPDARQWYDYFWFSVATAATPGYALYKPVGMFKFMAGIEAILGTFMWAAFITTFARKFMR